MDLKMLSVILIGCMVCSNQFLIEDCVTADICYENCKQAIIESNQLRTDAINVTMNYFNQTKNRMDQIEAKTSEDRIFVTSMSGGLLGLVGGFALAIFLIKTNPPQFKYVKSDING